MSVFFSFAIMTEDGQPYQLENPIDGVFDVQQPVVGVAERNCTLVFGEFHVWLGALDPVAGPGLASRTFFLVAGSEYSARGDCYRAARLSSVTYPI